MCIKCVRYRSQFFISFLLVKRKIKAAKIPNPTPIFQKEPFLMPLQRNFEILATQLSSTPYFALYVDNLRKIEGFYIRSLPFRFVAKLYRYKIIDIKIIKIRIIQFNEYKRS